ncbi:MAG: hypothetical protein WKF58_05895 [Ilumatobacteraceae bacterium]
MAVTSPARSRAASCRSASPIERGAHVDRSVLLPGAIVRSGATVRRTVVDAGVTIGRDRDVGGARGGIAVVGNAMTVRKGTRIAAGEQRPLRR